VAVYDGLMIRMVVLSRSLCGLAILTCFAHERTWLMVVKLGDHIVEIDMKL
jgi:hypothetical protein